MSNIEEFNKKYGKYPLFTTIQYRVNIGFQVIGQPTSELVKLIEKEQNEKEIKKEK